MNPALSVDIEIMCHPLMFCSKLYPSCWMTEVSACIMHIRGHEEEDLFTKVIIYVENHWACSVNISAHHVLLQLVSTLDAACRSSDGARDKNMEQIRLPYWKLVCSFVFIELEECVLQV
uniref:Uncharacterized protein n=1 Tax=Salix viminalis TaxID=40686 RepID=A0A6N2KJU9_SALVM